MDAPDAVDSVVLDEAAAARRAAAVRAALDDAGVGAGDLVATLCGNDLTAVAARDAATAADLVLAPINPRLAPAEIAWLLDHARPRAVLIDRGHAAALATARAATTGPGAAAATIVVDELADGDPTDAAPARGLYGDPAAAGATLLFTSGTTGRPKACRRTSAQDGARAAELRATYGLTADDVHLIACPLAHSAPGIFLRAARGAGARTVIQSGFRPRAFLDAVARHRATVFFLVPTQWQRLLALPDAARAAADWSSVRCAILAGAPVAPETKARIAAWLGPDRLWEFYGSSETGTVTVIGPRDHAAHPGSVGRPPAGVSLRVLDDAGAPVAAGEVGEVHVRSAAVMAGYLADDGTLSRPGERDGHVSVGDLGRVDADGWLTLVDRKHDTIISGGLNVYPAEIERVLAEHPDVAGAVCFGVPDDEWGQRVAAVIAPRPGATLDDAALQAFLRPRLAGYKLPRAVAYCTLDELPVGGSGKALRRAARARFAAALRCPPRRCPRRDPSRALRRDLSCALRRDPPPARYGATRPARYGATRPARYGATRPARYGATRPARYGATRPRATARPALRRDLPCARYRATRPARYGATRPARYGATCPARPALRATARPAPRATARPAPRATARPAPRATARPGSRSGATPATACGRRRW
ncbi:MAG: AMP-binding protein [Kofleriaceae bacterium]|nr:AMP-binding protein [Kofleriaceae bacterium]